jgi:hypothetical protein
MIAPAVNSSACFSGARASAGVNQAGLDVLSFQPRVGLQNVVGCISGGQHSKYMFDSNPSATDDRLAAKNLRIYGNTFQ